MNKNKNREKQTSLMAAADARAKRQPTQAPLAVPSLPSSRGSVRKRQRRQRSAASKNHACSAEVRNRNDSGRSLDPPCHKWMIVCKKKKRREKKHINLNET